MSAAFASSIPSGSVESRVNVTPLVDVMLVLLVIFMLSVPAATQRLPLSNARCIVACARPPDPVRVSIKATGEIYWNGAAVTPAALAANLAALLQQTQQPPSLELHPERGVRFERVTDVLEAAHNAGVRQIAVAALRE